MRDGLLFAHLRGFCDQRILWSFVIMLVHRDDMKDGRCIVNVNHLQKAYKFLTQIRADKFTSIQIRGEVAPYAINVLPVVPEEPSVPDLNAVIDPVDSLYQIIVKWYNFHDHTTPACAPHVLSRYLRQTFPPVLKASCRYYSPIIPFPMIIIFRRNIRWPLRKRKQIGPQMASL